jgi:GTPase-associated protein 1, N-terminal domain type 2/GTPase-associated protein 1, middle domain/GTPase-associated protein 1, C-terminal domain
MAFAQLYYTSCENGLSGYGGYQFNAVTPGVSPVVMREVEDRTVYEPPRWLLAGPRPDEPEAYPIAFSHGTSEAAHAAITTHVVFTGADYSGRPGNYFVHALATTAPEQDFGPLLPVELWGAELWQSCPVDGTELPELPGPPPRGLIDRPGVQAFLDARGGDSVLRELVTAVGHAMAGARPVLVASGDDAENVWWIGAVCYLLGDHLGRRVTFTTYSHRPGYSRYHLIGVPSDALPPDADTSFQVFDLAAGRTPAGGVHPLAALLADTGVMAAPALWQQAAAFSSGSEQGLDDWLAPVAVAAALLGRRLPPAELDAVARWLPGTSGWLPAQLADVALGIILARYGPGGTQPDGVLTDGRLLGLLDLARRLPLPARAAELESLLAARAVTHIARGEPAAPVPLTGAAAAAAQAQAAVILSSATPAAAAAMLDWAAASGVVVPDADLERLGRDGLDPGTPEPELTPLLRRSPAIRRGLLARLAGEPRQLAEALVAGPLGDLIGRDDLAAYPGLTELWLLRCAAKDSLPPLRAFDEIVDVREGAQRSPRVDGALLDRLWPGGCPPDQIAELLGAVTVPCEQDVLDWLAREISAAPPRDQMKGGWFQLAQTLAEHPVLPLLPHESARLMRSAAQVGPLLRRARAAMSGGDVGVFAELFASYQAADDDTRLLLDGELPVLLAEAEPLGPALRGCPESVAVAFCGELASRLAPLQPDVLLAERVFAALGDQDVLAQPALSERLADVFEQVRGWRRRDLGALGHALGHSDELTASFRAWRDERRGGLARRLFGSGSWPPAGSGGEGA